MSIVSLLFSSSPGFFFALVLTHAYNEGRSHRRKSNRSRLTTIFYYYYCRCCMARNAKRIEVALGKCVIDRGNANGVDREWRKSPLLRAVHCVQRKVAQFRHVLFTLRSHFQSLQDHGIEIETVKTRHRKSISLSNACARFVSINTMCVPRLRSPSPTFLSYALLMPLFLLLHATKISFSFFIQFSLDAFLF